MEKELERHLGKDVGQLSAEYAVIETFAIEPPSYQRIQSFALSPNGQFLVVLQDTNIYQFSVDSGQVLARFHGDPDQNGINFITVSGDNRYLYQTSFRGMIRKWPLVDAEQPFSVVKACAVLCGHSSRVYRLLSTKCGRVLYSCGFDGSIVKWTFVNPEDPQSLYQMQSIPVGARYVCCLSLSADDTFMFSSGADRQIRLWTTSNDEALMVDSGKVVPLNHRGFGHEINCMVVSPDGRWLCTGSCSGCVKIWEVSKFGTSEPRYTIGVPDLDSGVKAMVIAPNSKYLFVQSWDCHVYLLYLNCPTEPPQCIYRAPFISGWIPVSQLCHHPHKPILFYGTPHGLKQVNYQSFLSKTASIF